LIGMVIEPRRGTYALILSCMSNARIRIGRLGAMQLQPGYYVYVGSALGPGGLRARIAHHQKPSSRPHWHIDYLRAHTRLHSVWLNYHGRRHEHQWARAIYKMKDAKIPLPGFGASDCSCLSHLYFFKRCPTAITGNKQKRKREFTKSSSGCGSRHILARRECLQMTKFRGAWSETKLPDRLPPGPYPKAPGHSPSHSPVPLRLLRLRRVDSEQ